MDGICYGEVASSHSVEIALWQNEREENVLYVQESRCGLYTCCKSSAWVYQHRGSSKSFCNDSRLQHVFHQVIGGGAVGLAIARQLASRTGTSTILIERHGAVGTETSSRNSEVIHAGIYYGPDSLKTKLCLRGKHLLYDLCKAENIPYARTKKWIIAQDAQQFAEVEALHEFTKRIDVPTQFLSRKEIQDREPHVRAEAGVLESPTTGIVDSHAFMSYLEGSFDERGGDEVLHTVVTNIEGLGSGGDEGYAITTESKDGKGGKDIITYVGFLSERPSHCCRVQCYCAVKNSTS